MPRYEVHRMHLDGRFQPATALVVLQASKEKASWFIGPSQGQGENIVLAICRAVAGAGQHQCDVTLEGISGSAQTLWVYRDDKLIWKEIFENWRDLREESTARRLAHSLVGALNSGVEAVDIQTVAAK